MNLAIVFSGSLSLLLTAGAEAAATPPQDTAPRTATVIGRVVDKDGHPVGGATVELVRPANDTLPESLREYLPGGATVIATVETEASGRFAIDAEPGRALGLMARKGAGRLARPVADVIPGQPVTLQLLPAVEHRVRVVRAAAGGVLAPVAGASVRVLVQPTGQNDGALDVRSPRAGWREVAATGADGRVSVRAARGAPVMVRAFDEKGIAFAEGDLGGGEIVLDLGTADAHGIVVDGGGDPLANARVHFGWRGSGERAQVTGADGRFVVSAGSLACVIVESEGGGPAQAFVEPGDRRYPKNEPLVVRVPDGDRVRARLTNAAGESLRNAPVLLQGHARWDDMSEPCTVHARTDANGVLDRRCVDAESSVIGWVRCDGVWVCFHAAGDGRDHDLGEVRIHTDGRLRGTVLDEHGSPAAFAGLLVQPDWSEDVRTDVDDTEEACRVLHADHAGRFEIAGLGLGPHRLLAVTNRTRPVVRLLTATPDPEPIQVRLTAASTIHGIVCGPDETPIAGVRVRARMFGAPEELWSFRLYGGWALTGADGRFVVACYSDEPQTVWAMQRTADGYRSGDADDVQPGSHDVRIVLSR